jgi:hypothetical protein
MWSGKHQRNPNGGPKANHPRELELPSRHRIETFWWGNNSEGIEAAKLYLDWQGKSILALDFADLCIAEWERLLSSHKMI